MKKVFITLVGIFLIIFVISLARDTIIKISVEKGIEFITGLGLKIQGFKFGLVRQIVGIKNLSLLNPKNFKERTMMGIPEIYVDYDLPSAIKGKIHVEDMRINISEFMVVKNEKGELNLDALKVVKAQKEEKKAAARPKRKAPQIKIDSLELKIGRVVYKDYSAKDGPLVKEFNLNIDERYTDITNPYTLVSLIVVKALANTTISNLADFDLGGLQGTVADTLVNAKKVAEEATVKAHARLEEAQKKAEEALGEAQQSIKKTEESLKELLKIGDK